MCRGSGGQQLDQWQGSMSQRNREFVFVIFFFITIRRFRDYHRLRGNGSSQILQRGRYIVGQQGTRHGAAVPHQLEQLERDIAEHQNTRVGRGGSG